MNDSPIVTDEVHETIFREKAGVIEQETGADPERRLPGKVDIIFALEKLPEIINTGADDKQAAQGIRHCLEDPGFLHKNNVDDGDQWKGRQAIKQRAFCFRVADDHVQDIYIEAKGDDGRQIAEKNGVLLVQCLVLSVCLTDAVIEQVKREYPEVEFNGAVTINIKAGQKSDAAEDRHKIKENCLHSRQDSGYLILFKKEPPRCKRNRTAVRRPLMTLMVMVK